MCSAGIKRGSTSRSSPTFTSPPASAAAAVADVVQIRPSCAGKRICSSRGEPGRVVNIKKGQFLAPDDVRHAVAKVVDAEFKGHTSRSAAPRSATHLGGWTADLPDAARARVPVVFDVTHSLQLPGGGDGVTAGLAQYIEPLASAGVAAGVDGIFLEVHDDPARAKSDAQNALRLSLLEPLLRRLMALDAIVKQREVRIHG